MMELSKRLQAVADLVTADYKLADIGTDHAYIPICLIQQKKIAEAVALDVNEGPLQRAEEHIRENGLEAEIETRLSNGFQALQPGECVFLCLIIKKGKPLPTCPDPDRRRGSCAKA